MSSHKFNKVQAELINRWQTVHFEQEKAVDMYAKVDCLRTNLGHLQFAYATHSTSQAAISPFSDLLEKYASIIDTQDPAHGVNNYAEVALKLAESNKSEALEWKSHLSIHKVCNEDYVRKFLSSVKEHEPSEVNASPTLAQALCPRTQPAVLPKVFTRPTPPVIEKPNVESRTVLTNQQQNSWAMPQPPSREPTPTLAAANRNFFNTVGPKKAALHVDVGTEEGSNLFCTAKEQLIRENQKKNNNSNCVTPTTSSYGTVKKSLGARRGPSSKFVPPVLGRTNESHTSNHSGVCEAEHRSSSSSGQSETYDPQDENFKNIEPRMIELIINEILDQGPPVSWDDIAGLQFAKATIQEIVVWPMLRPDIFTGLRGPPKGLLLFGPPGTGKTLIGKCIASQSRATFFSISASSLTSKWIGEGEKMVRALFAVARSRQPAVVFIDEIDSLLTQRSESEHESSRRMKTEFLVQLDGATTRMDERILVVGATNRPQELDEAARRRLVKRLYIPLPDFTARCQIVSRLLERQHSLTEDQIQDICSKTEGYSGADVANLCREAALGPIRCLSAEEMQHITPDQVRPILYRDCIDALDKVKASVCEQDLAAYIDWNAKFGCGSAR